VQRLLQSGASGYVLKQSASEELVRGIRRVVAGQTYLDPVITEQAIGCVAARTGRERTAARSTLSKREEDVLRFVALGFLTREIAGRLNISIKTVETHKANAMKKMGMNSRIDIVRYAMLQGWLQET
jgi:DNA-binding NarL/FixJ family response regulator